ncbi:MAG: hypothetical protein EOP48_15430 [Sphingobacteriales bacterium]|nr:MAG: hypothetical protein EOP48_15430 [Sphingobacteriales bacterium]
MTFRPRLHPSFYYNAYLVGREKTPLLVIDNFMAQAELLVEYCAEVGRLEKIDTYYPGVRMQSPEVYVHALHHYLGDILEKVFELPLGEIQGSRALFSMVTTPPELLSPKQRLPHIDSFEIGDLACVHYLCSAQMGGTAMYRHKSTGYETINSSQIDHYNDVLINEGALQSDDVSYMHGANQYFDQIADVGAIFNRLIIYPSNILHSGSINPDCILDTNPRKGRLTLNTFIYRKRTKN